MCRVGFTRPAHVYKRGEGCIKPSWGIPRRALEEAMDGIRVQLNTYYDLAATTGITDELRARIAEATQVLAQLEAMETAVEPEMVDAEEIKAARDDLYRLAESGDPEAAQLILKQFVVEMTVDSGKKTVEGILRDPRSFDTRCMAAPRGVEPLSRP